MSVSSERARKKTIKREEKHSKRPIACPASLYKCVCVFANLPFATQAITRANKRAQNDIRRKVLKKFILTLLRLLFVIRHAHTRGAGFI